MQDTGEISMDESCEKPIEFFAVGFCLSAMTLYFHMYT